VTAGPLMPRWAEKRRDADPDRSRNLTRKRVVSKALIDTP
jgi:hypothetical protein